jgi:hypothetical protein
MPRLLALLAAALLAAPLFAGPTADVMRLVPPKTTVCFVVQDLRGTAARLGDSPFAAFFADSKLGEALLTSEELKQLSALEKLLSEHLGLSFAALRDDVLGDAVAFAYQPPADGNADADSGVVIGKAARPESLAKLVAKLNAAQVQSKELKATAEKSHNKIGYVERQKADGKTEYYLLREDGVFAYTGQEAVLKQVIDRLDGTDKTPCPLAGAIDKLGAADAVAVLLFDPAAFAADLTAQAKESADPNEKAFLTQFARLWTASEAVGVSLTLNQEATLAVTAVAAPDKVPEELRGLFKSDDKASALWSVIPADALLAVGGRFEWDKFHPAFRSFLSDEGKAGLRQLFDDVIGPLVGKKALPKVLAGLGPDWGLWLSAPAKGDAGPLPTATLAIRVRPAGGTDDTVGQAVVGAVDTLLHTFRVGYNRTHDDQYTLTDEKADGGTVKVLTNDTALPAGVRPAYGLRGDFFVMGSNPEAVRRFTPPKSDAAVKDAPLVRLNAVGLAKYLNAHGSELGEVLAGWTGETPDKAKSDLTDFAAVLELFDTLEVHHAADGKRMSLSVKAKPVKPLKK